jgi:lactate permease
VFVALLVMLGMARLLVHAGMIESLASAAALALGGTWPALAPAVGALGTFVTGSATASNALFTDLQAATAEAAGLGVTTVLGGQAFGAAVGNVIAPHNLIAAAAVVGLAGREAEILRRTLPVAVLVLVLGGILGLLLARSG